MCPRPSLPQARSETMSILSSVTSVLEPIKNLGIPSEECKPTKSDDRGDDKHKGREEWKNDDHEKQAKDDDHSKHAKNDDHSKHAKDDDHSKHAKDDDHSKHAKNDDCGKDNPGEALAKLDFSHGDYGSHGPDHSGDLHGALASMSSDHALDYAIGQMGPADHFDVGHFDVPADTSHDMVHHA